MVKISVIVPIFNGEFYLQEALDSIVNQTMIKDIEVIMVDDGSTDNSRHIIDKYALNYENFFAYHLENKGVTFARNFGIEIAKGEYIHLMDADDYLDNEAYEKLYELASKYNHDVVMGNFLRFNSRRTWDLDIPKFIFENIHETIENTDLIKNKELAWDMFLWNKLYKRDFLNKNNIRFPNKNLTFQDNLFSIQVYVKAKTVGMLHDYVYFWRARENNTSITQVINIKWATDRFEILNMVHDFVTNNISNKGVLYTKYLKWLDLDLPNLIRKVKEFPIENHEFLLNNLYQIVNLVPNEFFNELNSYKKVLFSMVKNKDWNNLLKFISYDLKNKPDTIMDIDDIYIEELDFKKDAENEDLNASVSSIELINSNLFIKINYSIPYLVKDNVHSLQAFLVNDNFKIPIEITNNQIIIPADILNFEEYEIKIIYNSNSFLKETLLKTISKNTFILNNVYLKLFFDEKGIFHLKKTFFKDFEFIKNVILDDEKIIFYFNENSKLSNVKINDSLLFKSYDFNINHDGKTPFFCIYYRDLLTAPIKKWELFNACGPILLKLDKTYEKYTENYHIQVKNNYGTVSIELNLYDPIKKINELNKSIIESKNKSKEKSPNLTNIKDDYSLIRELNLFDDDFYLKSYPELNLKNVDPLKHYLNEGFKNQRNPSPTFNNNFYLEMYGDVCKNDVNPLVHYAKYGIKEKYLTTPFSDYLPGTFNNNKKYLTKDMVRQLALEDSYYINKWQFFDEIITIMKGLRNINNILEIFPYKSPLVENSDILDFTNRNIKFYPLKINNFYKYDNTNLPLHFKEKQYDLIILCMEILQDNFFTNKEYFNELKRISNKILVVLPYSEEEFEENALLNKINSNWDNEILYFQYIFDKYIIRIYEILEL